MIKANELRIGNWVSTIDNKIECTSVKGFYGFPVNSGIINHNNNVNDFEYLISIPLTEEWLIKFGFEKGEHNWFRLYFDYYNLDDSDCFTYNINSKMLCLESFYRGDKKGSIQLLSLDEKYVHQLQNLYFALTGEELELVK